MFQPGNDAASNAHNDGRVRIRVQPPVKNLDESEATQFMARFLRTEHIQHQRQLQADYQPSSLSSSAAAVVSFAALWDDVCNVAESIAECGGYGQHRDTLRRLRFQHSNHNNDNAANEEAEETNHENTTTAGFKTEVAAESPPAASSSPSASNHDRTTTIAAAAAVKSETPSQPENGSKHNINGNKKDGSKAKRKAEKAEKKQAKEERKRAKEAKRAAKEAKRSAKRARKEAKKKEPAVAVKTEPKQEDEGA